MIAKTIIFCLKISRGLGQSPKTLFSQTVFVRRDTSRRTIGEIVTIVGKAIAQLRPHAAIQLVKKLSITPCARNVAIPETINDIIPETIRPKTIELKDVESKASLSKNESIYSALKLGLKDYVRKNKFKKVLIGISGGIDSALTAAICVDALGAENVIGVAMPSKYNSKDSLDDAIELSDNLGITLKTIEIEKLVDDFRETLTNSLNEDLGQITDENIQSRVRGNILMGLSNQTGAMVVSTGNKSEMAVGYSTLYGDLAGGFALIKDLYKTKVYELSNYINSISDAIPKNIITKEPSAELRPNQFDSDSLPDYEVLDKILNLYIEEDSSSEKIIASGVDPDLVFDVLEKVDRNEYKRKQVAPGVKLTQKAFGKDRRMPITNTYIRPKE